MRCLVIRWPRARCSLLSHHGHACNLSDGIPHMSQTDDCGGKTRQEGLYRVFYIWTIVVVAEPERCSMWLFRVNVVNIRCMVGHNTTEAAVGLGE
jgi:hypothetical protein